ncbi:2OG-Fe(II) oxygenase [Blastopirellula marina]|uniref:Proline hydroxylase n=1 Tax=Blastopirellula marina TaxID=124 RepID=A0A2S8GAM5_9BACT|nr:2OG-Fe(II) oxygenase [Blastopirellula marina]PQO41487.1 proline hydroxylase [Blastopirellula marina]
MTHDVSQLDWDSIRGDLDAHGYAVIDLLTPEQCALQIATFEEDARFRKHVIMQEHGYGRGEYKYFAYPLPDLIAELRMSLYGGLAEIANRWYETLEIDVRFPPTYAEFLDRCHQAGQQKPTPLLLRYQAEDFNCLHQDVYGEHVFPLQVAVLLNRPSVDFSGGEFLLTAERDRSQSQAEVVPLQQGQGVIFPVRQRPQQETGQIYPVDMRHGVSRIRSGLRHTLGIIFHDAA